MSSSVTLRLAEPADLKDWMTVCRAHDIVYSPRTIGGNVFYRGQIEISLDQSRPFPGGNVIQADGCKGPPARFDIVRIGSFHGEGYAMTGELARAVAARFPCLVHADPELADQVVGIPRRVDIDESVLLPTDVEGGWDRDGDSLHARVEAGDARLRTVDGLVALEVGGVHLASFRDLQDAMTYAGRASFDWWQGPRPAPTPTVPRALR